MLAASLTLFSWLQLQHEVTDHLGHHDDGCEICAFNGHLGNSPVSTSFSSPTLHIPLFLYTLGPYDSPNLTQPYRLTISVRGPPSAPA